MLNVFCQILIIAIQLNDVCKGSSALIIATEWNEFRALDLNKIKDLMKNPVIFDLRNIYNKEEVEDLGIEYHGVGK